MNKIRGYEQFNEARRPRNKGGKPKSRTFGGNSNGFNNRLGRNLHTELPSSIISNKIGMPMAYSERFEYIINKIAAKNNVIAKELLKLPALSGETFQYSYLDLESAESISYLYYTDKGISENDKYKSAKRQRSKVYKIVKSIFGSRFTKTDVTKFVSLYKTVYMQGPDKSDIPKIELSNEQIAEKLYNDTKKDKLKWDKIHDIPYNMTKYSAFVKITEHKGILFDFLRFVDKHEGNSLITVNLINKMGKTEAEKRIWLKTIDFKDMTEFFNLFIEKYEKSEQ